MRTLITSLDSSTHARIDHFVLRDVLLRNGKDVCAAIFVKWGVKAERYMPRSYRGGNFIFNVYLEN